MSESKGGEGSGAGTTFGKTPKVSKPEASETKAREVIAEEASAAAPTEFWPTGSSPEELKFMIESLMAMTARQNDVIRRLQVQVHELWKENTASGRGHSFERSDKLVVVGFTRYTEAYSADTGDWRELPSVPTARRDCAAASLGSELFVLGGVNSSTGKVSNLVEIYDIETHSWRPGPPLKVPRSSHDAIAYNGCLYVCGGCNDSAPIDSVECYDPDTGEWTLCDSMTEAREGLGVTSFEGKLVAVGGKNTKTGGTSDTVEVYEPSKGWSHFADLPKPLGFCSAAVWEGKLVAAGNGTTPGGTFNAPGTVFIRDTTEDHWISLSDRTVTANSSNIAMENLHGRLVAVASEGAEEYDAVTAEWIALPRSRVRHFGCDAAVLHGPSGPPSPKR